MNPRLVLLLGLVASAAAMRLLPHPPNFTPVAALALFAGAHFERRAWAFAVPLAAMLLSDLALQGLHGYGFHSTLPAVYASFVAVVGIGLALRTRRRPLPVAAASLAASVLFFAATNLAVWAEGLLYPRSAEGLVACYVAAIPFFGATVLGDLFYSGVLFGLFAAADRRLPRAATA
ncbi:MAG TPA: DUF6580 family putative transport protein [Candidatus Binatia bacterium]|nr:DUF6580 family putative transport protein [Candidatus Binatia bacterium]